MLFGSLCGAILIALEPLKSLCEAIKIAKVFNTTRLKYFSYLQNNLVFPP
jgi:hypothetical protein